MNLPRIGIIPRAPAPPRVVSVPTYRCAKCDVTGTAERCWCCNSNRVELFGRALVVP